MTQSSNGPRVPGAMLLKIASLLFTEPVVNAVVRPTIADLQREVADAGPSRGRRLRARWRGYRAFWTLTLIAALTPMGASAGEAGAIAFPDAVARFSVGTIVLALLALAGPRIGTSAAVVFGAAAVLAIVIHGWYKRHPSDLPTPSTPVKGSPQINFSSTEVAGNIGGLIFAIGSVFIVAIAVPSLVWFLFAALVAGGFLAWGLVAWRTSHPYTGRPENPIVPR